MDVRTVKRGVRIVNGGVSAVKHFLCYVRMLLVKNGYAFCYISDDV